MKTLNTFFSVFINVLILSMLIEVSLSHSISIKPAPTLMQQLRKGQPVYRNKKISLISSFGFQKYQEKQILNNIFVSSFISSSKVFDRDKDCCVSFDVIGDGMEVGYSSSSNSSQYKILAMDIDGYNQTTYLPHILLCIDMSHVFLLKLPSDNSSCKKIVVTL